MKPAVSVALCLAALAAGAATPARAEVAAVSEAGFVIKLEAQSPANLADTWQALIAPGKWWSDDHTYSGKGANMYLDAQATGCFCEKLPVPEGAPEGQRMGSVEHMHVIYADPARRTLRLSGGLGPLQGEAVNGTWTVRLKPVSSGTVIAWDYAVGGYSRLKFEEIAPLVDRVMGQQIAALAKHLGAVEPVADEVDPAGAKASAPKATKAKPKGDQKAEPKAERVLDLPPEESASTEPASAE